MNRWTDETEELVALAIHVADCEASWEECRTEQAHRRAVREVLSKLADAGLLTPPGSEVVEQEGELFSHDNITGRDVIDRCDRGTGRTMRYRHDRHRRVIATPWTDVKPDGSPE